MYLLSKEEREEIHEFMAKQLRKEYIRPSKLISVFFARKKNDKKKIV